MFVTKKDVTEKDIRTDSKTNKTIAKGYWLQTKKDTRSSHAKIIDKLGTKIISLRKGSKSEETLYDTTEEKEIEARAIMKSNHPNRLVERRELLVLETKASHDGLHDEMLYISNKLLYLNIISQERLDNFVFNYGKLKCPQLRGGLKFLENRD